MMEKKGAEYRASSQHSPLASQSPNGTASRRRAPDCRPVAPSSPAPPLPPRAIATTPAQRALHQVTKNRATWWSPIKERDEEDGYEEHDDFGEVDRLHAVCIQR